MIFENSEKAIAIKSFQYLWKTEDKEWLANRKKNWVILAKDEFYDCPAPELKRYKNYYLTGERQEYIHPATLFLLTPFGSSVESAKFFDSAACDDPERLLSDFVVAYANSDLDTNLLRPYVIFFSEGVLGKEYIVVERGMGKNKKNISPNPSFWSRQYVGLSIKYFKDRHKDYSPVVDVLDYFISALRVADKNYERLEQRFSEFMSVVQKLEVDPRPHAQKFLNNLKRRESEILESWNSPLNSK